MKITTYNKGKIFSIMEWKDRTLTFILYHYLGQEDQRVVVEGCQTFEEARALINR